MISEPMPPMPSRFLVTQLAYAKMITEVHDIVRGTSLTPQMALLVAFLGEQVMTRKIIHHCGYFIGTNLTYTLAELERSQLIERLNGAVSDDARKRPIRLTDAGRKLALAIRTRLAAECGYGRSAAEAA